MNCLFHPLVGTPPVFASGLASMLGLNAQKASALLFQNSSTPGGLITVPGEANDEQIQRIKEEWEQRYSRINLGRVGILTAGATYQKMPLTAVETQMIEQLKWSAEVVCSVYHVPPYKVGVGPLPSYNNVQALNVEYYSQGLQSHIEEIEELVADALGLGPDMGIEFDTENILRMDSVTQVTVLKEAIGAGVMSPNEGRSKFDLKPVKGGESPYLQQQNYSLAALAKRDAQADPFAPKKPPTPSLPPAAAGGQDQPKLPPPPPDAQKLAALAHKFTEALRAA
jgi:HK97 family phage portal protein